MPNGYMQMQEVMTAVQTDSPILELGQAAPLLPAAIPPEVPDTEAAESIESGSTTAGDLILPEEKREQAYCLRKMGKSQEEIAKLFNVNVSTIYRWQKQFVEDYKKRREDETANDKVQEILIHYDHIIKTNLAAAGDCKKGYACPQSSVRW